MQTSDVAAPSEVVLPTNADNDYAVLAGEEQSSPHPPLSRVELMKVQADRKTNVQVAMWSSLTSTLVFSIIQWNIFDAYLAVLASANKSGYVNSSVGFAESICGATSLLLTVPTGFMVDNFCRVKIIRCSCILGLVASVVSFYAFATDSLYILYFNLFLWGVFNEFSGSASEAVFADSILPGQRSKFYSRKGILERLGLSLGPVIMMVLFYLIGDAWTLRQLHIPLLIGCCLAPMAIGLLWMFRDPRPDVEMPDSPNPSPVDREPAFLVSPTLNREMLTSASPSSALFTQKEDDCLILPHSDRTEPLDTATSTPKRHRTAEDCRIDSLTTVERAIPFLVVGSDFVRKVGAGMTIKFFPLFFIYDYGFRPIDLNLLYTVYPVTMSIFCWMLQLVADSLGRTQGAILFQLLGIALLVSMCYVQNVWAVLVLFLLRGSVQNAGYPIDRSIIMDYVHSKRRGMWNAVETFTSMTWSGSAVLGGMLADSHDYRYTFKMTAAIYLVACFVYLPLLWLVPRKETEVAANQRKRAVRKKVVPAVPRHDTYAPCDDPTAVDIVMYATEDDGTNAVHTYIKMEAEDGGSTRCSRPATGNDASESVLANDFTVESG